LQCQRKVQVFIGGCFGVGSSIGAWSGKGMLSGGGSFSGWGGGMSGSGVVWARISVTAMAVLLELAFK
jgi:hypothetical protein